MEKPAFFLRGDDPCAAATRFVYLHSLPLGASPRSIAPVRRSSTPLRVRRSPPERTLTLTSPHRPLVSPASPPPLPPDHIPRFTSIFRHEWDTVVPEASKPRAGASRPTRGPRDLPRPGQGARGRRSGRRGALRFRARRRRRRLGRTRPRSLRAPLPRANLRARRVAPRASQATFPRAKRRGRAPRISRQGARARVQSCVAAARAPPRARRRPRRLRHPVGRRRRGEGRRREARYRRSFRSRERAETARSPFGRRRRGEGLARRARRRLRHR